MLSKEKSKKFLLIIVNEEHDILQHYLIQLCTPFKHVDGCSIRVDNAPGFLALKHDKLLSSLGITLDFGRIKNKNHNPVADKIIQEFEIEIQRLAPNGGPITLGTLSIVVCHINSRIRYSGLSASEIIMKRDRITNEPIYIDDKKLQDIKYNKRVQNHHYSEKSKSNGKPFAKEALVEIGNIVYIKSDGSKHLARELYLATSVDYKSSEAYVQKLVDNQFREKKYLVKFSEIYLVPSPKSGKCSSERPDSARHLQPAHLVSCIIRGGTANINFVHNNRA